MASFHHVTYVDSPAWLNAARFCNKAMHEIGEIQRVCECAVTRVTFERSINAVKKIFHILTIDHPEAFLLDSFPPMTNTLDAHDSLVLYSHYLRGVCNATHPLIQGSRPDHLTEREFGELKDLVSIVHIDCENACFRAALAEPIIG